MRAIQKHSMLSQSADCGSFCRDLWRAWCCTNQHFSSAGAQKQLKCTSGAPFVLINYSRIYFNMGQNEKSLDFQCNFSQCECQSGILGRKRVKKKRWKHKKSWWFLPLVALLTASFIMKFEKIILFKGFLRLNLFWINFSQSEILTRKHV